jgi:hypothetical protein
MNAQLDRYIKLMAGLNGCKGIEFSPLNDLITSGNKKIPSTTAIFNMGSATDCPSRKLGFCQAINKNGKNICYARKSEYEYHPTVLPYRRRQEKYWKSCTAEQFVIDFLTLNALKALPYTALRLREYGEYLRWYTVRRKDRQGLEYAREIVGFVSVVWLEEKQ